MKFSKNILKEPIEFKAYEIGKDTKLKNLIKTKYGRIRLGTLSENNDFS